MTTAMQELLARVSRMPEDEQEQIALWILGELEADERWDRLLAESKELLRDMAREAGREYEACLTEPLDLDSL